MAPPDENDPNVVRLVNQSNDTHESLYLEVKPELNGELDECFPNVENKVKTAGGKMVLGWRIWKTQHLVEAKFHAVWEDTNGDLIDITSKQFSVGQILFVEDSNASYREKQVENKEAIENTKVNQLI